MREMRNKVDAILELYQELSNLTYKIYVVADGNGWYKFAVEDPDNKVIAYYVNDDIGWEYYLNTPNENYGRIHVDPVAISDLVHITDRIDEVVAATINYGVDHGLE